MSLFKSIGAKCVCEVCFLGVVCAGALRVYACLRAYAHVRHRSRPSDNKRFLQPSIWVPSPDSAGTWSLPPSHLMPAGLVCTHEEKAARICKQTRTEMYTHWFDPAVPWQAWDLGLGCGVRGPQRVGKPDSNWVFFTGLDWVQSVTARVESCKKKKLYRSWNFSRVLSSKNSFQKLKRVTIFLHSALPLSSSHGADLLSLICPLCGYIWLVYY